MQATQSEAPVVMPLIPYSPPVPVGDAQAINQKMEETLKNISAMQSAFKVIQEENAQLKERIAVLEAQNKVVNTKVENLTAEYKGHIHWTINPGSTSFETTRPFQRF
jgi:hypothetical protein